eukprot:PhF_6_TR1053/c0_g1_i1/m.2179
MIPCSLNVPSLSASMHSVGASHLKASSSAATTTIFIDRSERLAKALSTVTHRTRQDSVMMRVWDTVILTAVSLSYFRWTSVLALFNESRADVISSQHVVTIEFLDYVCFALSAFYLADVYIRWKVLHPRDRLHYSWKSYMFNFVTALPWDIISLAMANTRTVASYVGTVQALRIFLIPTLFHSESPDVVDVLYVNFYYTFLPKAKIVVVTVLSLHTLTIVHLLCIEDGSYRTSMLWVWTLITSAPLNISTRNENETVLAGLLMLLSMMVQGYFVSTVSALLMGFDMKEQNRSHMLITLEMLRYYKVPRELQEEVLSFQYHVLQDSSMQTHFVPELERLPPMMLLEIDLCVKVGVLNKVTFFDPAPKECKRELAAVMKQVMVNPMTTVITTGEVGLSMYFMLHGLADVTLPNGLIVATIRRGDCFGEMALINADARRTATVCSLTFCDILELTKTDFDAAIVAFPEFLNIITSRRAARGTPVTAVVVASTSGTEGEDNDSSIANNTFDSDDDIQGDGGGDMGLCRFPSASSVLVDFDTVSGPLPRCRPLTPPTMLTPPNSAMLVDSLVQNDHTTASGGLEDDGWTRNNTVSSILQRASQWKQKREEQKVGRQNSRTSLTGLPALRRTESTDRVVVVFDPPLHDEAVPPSPVASDKELIPCIRLSDNFMDNVRQPTFQSFDEVTADTRVHSSMSTSLSDPAARRSSSPTKS